jgi:hypothetical protein
MKRYEFIERVNVYYTVEAENADEAWAKLDKLEVSYDAIRDKGDVDIIDCCINYEEEIENA